MNFRTLKTNIISILETASLALPSAQQFEVIGGQRQKSGSKDINFKKKVAVYYLSTDFSVNSGSVNGEVQTDPIFRILPIVSSKATAADITDPLSLIESNIVADDEIDLLIEDIYQIIMDARNMDLGMPIGQVSNRYIKNVEKSPINNDGNNSVIMANMDLSLKTPEQVPGDEGVVGTSVDSNIDIVGEPTVLDEGEEPVVDPVQKTGIEITP